MKKKLISLLCAGAMLSTVLTGCGGAANDAQTAADKTVTETTAAKTETTEAKKDGEVTKIRFYGADSEYNQNIVAGFMKENPDISIEIVPVDYDNAEQVIKTGISSNDPVDVSFFWGGSISNFVSCDMALDLTPYLEENNSEWKNTIVSAYIESCKIDGKYYAVPYQPVIETIFINTDLFKQYNVEIPTTWDEMMAACEVFKENGLYGIGCSQNLEHQMLQFVYQRMANNGTIEDYCNAKLDFSKSEELKQTLEDIKSAYDADYMYPGEGALTCTYEQIQTAWYQGKVAMLFDAGSKAGEYSKNSEFEMDILPFPYVQENGKYALNTVTNALFIPVNSKHPEEAIRFMKYYTSDAGIQEIINSGRLPSTVSMQSKVESQIMKNLLATSVGDNVVGYKQMQGISPEMSLFLQEQLVGGACMGTSIDELLAQMEEIRQNAINN